MPTLAELIQVHATARRDYDNWPGHEVANRDPKLEREGNHLSAAEDRATKAVLRHPPANRLEAITKGDWLRTVWLDPAYQPMDGDVEALVASHSGLYAAA